MSTRDQKRALHAYQCVEKIAKQDKPIKAKYKILVNGLGASILRSGLAATVAFIEREKNAKAVTLLLDHLAAAEIPGITGAGATLPGQVRKLERDAYILATRELLRVVLWFRRAVQATLGDVDEDEAEAAS